MKEAEDVTKSMNWPALFRPKQEWRELLSQFCKDEEIDGLIDLFTFAADRFDSDIFIVQQLAKAVATPLRTTARIA